MTWRAGLAGMALSMRAAPLFLAVLSLACRSSGLQAVDGELRLTPPALDFGEVMVGQTATRTVEAANDSRAVLPGTWRLAGDGFSVDGPASLPPGGTAASVHCTPAAAGPLEATLELTSPGLSPLRVSLRATAVDHPACLPAPCQASAWSDAEARCVDAPLPDGIACDDVCLDAPTCQGGRCVGPPRRCDDGDACTLDVCRPGLGCASVPLPPCPGDGRCQLGVCDPRRGCGTAPAPDGTACGARGCAAAQICLAGVCETRRAPDGYLCALPSPCQGEGRCQGELCVQPDKHLLSPSWTRGAPEPDGGPPVWWSDLLVAPDGGVALSSYFMSPPLLGAGGAGVSLPSTGRRCILWGGELVCADYPDTLAAPVSMLDAAGATAWTYATVLTDVPELARYNAFLARLAVLSEARLLALFEARTLTAAGVDTRCRHYGAVLLDRRGQRLASTFLQDGTFEICTHPHSYGVATDVQGNAYFAFTSSQEDNPAVPTQGTLLMSYTPELRLRWKRFEPGLGGGELAVVRGVLFHQASRVAWDAATGAPAGTMVDPFGPGVATAEVLVPGPLSLGRTTLYGLDRRFAPAWEADLPPGALLASDQLRLARWQTPAGPATVLLTFLSYPTESASYSLFAVDAATGRAAFECPLAIPAAPLMLELGPGGAALMSASAPRGLPCASCDPRYARSKNQFSWVPLPGLAPADAPWAGTWGGSGHDHQEH